MDYNKCQVFTPEKYALKLLNIIGYKNNLYNKKIMENACGDGNILVEIVRRYIRDCKKCGMNLFDIKKGIERDIYGAEISAFHHKRCIDRLNNECKKHGIDNVKWNIYLGDVLKKRYEIKFRYVVSNPPYITYTNIDNANRKYLRKNYDVCKHGKFDYYYAFIEKSINMLDNLGQVAYLVPNNIFKNEFAKDLRQLSLENLKSIYDYKNQKIFNKLTFSTIININKTYNENYITYYDVNKKVSHKIKKDKLKDKWYFAKLYTNKVNCKFSDYFKVACSVATLSNKCFLIRDYDEDDEYVYVSNKKIEKSLLKNAVSSREFNYNKKRSPKIIYPYYYIDNKLKKYKLEEFSEKFPCGSKYIYQFHNELKKRKSEKNTKWYEYGRSQALTYMNNDKLILSCLITDKVKIYNCSKDDIPYSGMFIVSKSGVPLIYAKKILESKEFMEYVKVVGYSSNGTSLRITTKDINNYCFMGDNTYVES